MGYGWKEASVAVFEPQLPELALATCQPCDHVMSHNEFLKYPKSKIAKYIISNSTCQLIGLQIAVRNLCIMVT